MTKRIFALIVFCLLMLIPLNASAIEPIAPESPVSLTLAYSYDDTAFQGLEIGLYRVASISPNSSFNLTGDFANYALAINSVKSQSEWNAIAQTAMSYVIADSIQPVADGVTNENGDVAFENLQTGLYLVNGVRADYDKGYCGFDSFMLVLPAANADGSWSYEVDAKPKSTYVQTQPDDVEYSLVKLWKDTGYESIRPNSVEISLYKDGVFAEKVTLSADNNWSYKWTAPGDGAVWTAVEQNVAKGYTVMTEQKEQAFVVTNTYSKNPPPPETGDTNEMGIYMILCVIAGIGLVVLGATTRRNCSNEG